jgi:hypothetical protein
MEARRQGAGFSGTRPNSPLTSSPLSVIRRRRFLREQKGIRPGGPSISLALEKAFVAPWNFPTLSR